MVNIDKILINCLDTLESRENSLLTWGIVDAFFSYDEVMQVINANVNGQQDSEDIFNELIKRQLIFDFTNSEGELCFRTRMAETVRLLSKNRQLFSNNWDGSPDLVGDYRFLKRPRLYPKRNISVDNVLFELTNYDKLSKEVIKAIVGPFELGRFQIDATNRISNLIGQKDSFGTIVCAGTGSGKTLSFYLPAISTIASSISNDSSFWTRTLTIYPRNELLKDQLSETVSMLQKVNPVLEANEIRPITVGAYFGPTPHDNGTILNEKVWESVGGGHICPFVFCPICGGRMKWRSNDRENNNEVLFCEQDDSHLVSSIKLTRASIEATAPDILFTTTEMLNQRMADSDVNKIFGIGLSEKQKPLLFLLDEVHTYYGTHGAHVASLIRRWRHLSKAKPHFVGLSATLQNAQKFFSTLTGLNETSVVEVSPLPGDMEEEGSEYMVVIRGNPVSKKSLMSTTIQTALLMNRVLDYPCSRNSKGVYGTKQFIFGDDLDAINRLFYNILDAEGRNSWGEINNARTPLASFRNPAGNLKFEAGQDWSIGVKIGHDLNSRPKISRVSSQDAGTDPDATTIVASSSLEVGFNDPEVGVVIQHKAPRDNVSFLQRKGRAGRKRIMRPWTIVVLSDYGRDRLAYQNYDHLFDPEVSVRNLPVKNLYVLRMQVVYATMDWLYTKLHEGNVWRDISGTKNGQPPNLDVKQRRERISNVLKAVLKCEYEYKDLEIHIKSALQILRDDAEQVLHTILWEHPRGLMVSVIPSLLRKIETNWTRNGVEWTDRYVFWHPLPDFVASTLFGELNLAEVRVRIPAQNVKLDEEHKPMAIQQAMKEFAPGRISKRFATDNTHAGVWINPYKNDDHSIHLKDYCGLEYTQYPEEFIFFDGGDEKSIPCIKPHKILTSKPDNTLMIGDTSNAFLNWKSQFINKGGGVVCELPKESNWSEIIENLTFFVHNNHSSIEVRRFTLGSKANISFKNRSRDPETLACNFVKDVDSMFSEGKTEPVAVGYSQEVDGFSINFKMPERIFCDASRQSLRVNYFVYLFNKQSNKNIFLSDRIVRVYLTLLIYMSYSEKTSIEDALAELKQRPFADNLKVIEQIIETTIGISSPANRTDLIEELVLSFNDNIIWDLLLKITPVLYIETAFDEDNWLVNVYKATIGATVHLALQKLCPDLDLDEVLVDTELSKNEVDAGQYVVWFTEHGPGGLGVIERVLGEYNRDPRKLLDMIENCLSETTSEQVDKQMYQILEKLNNGTDMQATINDIRSVSSFESRVSSFKKLQTQIGDMGLDAENHYLISCISNRLLKSGTSPDTDASLFTIIRLWKELEARIGIDVDIESFAFCAVKTENIPVFAAANNTPQAQFNSVYSMLWSRGGKVRSESLSVYNPFSAMLPTERLLVRNSLTKTIQEITLTNTTQFYIDLERVLEEDGIIKVKSKTSEMEELAKMIQRLIINGLDIFSLILFPRVVGVEKLDEYTYTTIDIREKIQ